MQGQTSGYEEGTKLGHVQGAKIGSEVIHIYQCCCINEAFMKWTKVL